MIVSVISPHTTGNGNTITSMLLALGIGSMNKKVLLTHTDAISDSFYTYLGLEQYEDKTTTPTQLVKLLREGAIQPEEISDYCKNINDGVFVFTNNKTNFTEDDMYAFSDFVLQLSDYDFIIYDVNNLETETSKMVIKKSDIVVFNLTQSIMELKEFKRQQDEFMKMCKGKQVILVCNKYSSTAGKDTDISKYLGLKTRCNVINYNPWVVNVCNSGRMLELYKTIRTKGVKVLELDKDISRLSTIVAKAKIATIKERAKKSKGLGV